MSGLLSISKLRGRIAQAQTFGATLFAGYINAKP